MRVSSFMAGLVALLLLLLSSSAVANRSIFDDYTTGVSCILGEDNVNAVSDAQFNTLSNLFGLPKPQRPRLGRSVSLVGRQRHTRPQLGGRRGRRHHFRVRR